MNRSPEPRDGADGASNPQPRGSSTTQTSPIRDRSVIRIKNVKKTAFKFERYNGRGKTQQVVIEVSGNDKERVAEAKANVENFFHKFYAREEEIRRRTFEEVRHDPTTVLL